MGTSVCSTELHMTTVCCLHFICAPSYYHCLHHCILVSHYQQVVGPVLVSQAVQNQLVPAEEEGGAEPAVGILLSVSVM